MKNSISRKVSTLAATLAIALPLTFIRPAVAQSNVSGNVTDVTSSTNSAALVIGNGSSAALGGVQIAQSNFSGTALATTTALNSAALVIGNNSGANIGGIEVANQSDVSGTLTAVTTSTNSAALVIGNNSRAAIGGVGVDSSKFSGTALSTTTSLNSAALVIGNGSETNIGGIDVKNHSDVSGGALTGCDGVYQLGGACDRQQLPGAAIGRYPRRKLQGQWCCDLHDSLHSNSAALVIGNNSRASIGGTSVR